MNFSRAVSFCRGLAMYPVNDTGSVVRPHRSFSSADTFSIHQFIRHKEVSIMKTVCKLAVSFGFTAVGLFGLQGSAMALITQTTQSAVMCVPQVSGQAGLGYEVNGVTNRSTINQRVFCPIVRSTEPTFNGTFFVNFGGFVPAGTRFKCALTSYSSVNQFLGQVSLDLPNDFPGSVDSLTFQRLELPKSKVPSGSFQTLNCSLPPRGGLLSTMTVSL